MAHQPQPVTTPKSAVGLLLCVLVAGCSVDHSGMAIEANGIQTMLLRVRFPRPSRLYDLLKGAFA